MLRTTQYVQYSLISMFKSEFNRTVAKDFCNTDIRHQQKIMKFVFLNCHKKKKKLKK